MKKKHFLPLFLLIVGIFLSAVHVQAAEKLISSDIACRSGNDIFYTPGNCRCNPIRKYNIKTKKETVITNMIFSNLNVYGDYIIAVHDQNGGSSDDVRRCYIYRMKKDGSQLKMLDHGQYAVVMGKWIYYVKTKLVKDINGCYTDKTLGIYRMRIDGSNKTRLYKTSESFYELSVSSSKVYFGNKYMNLDGTNLKKASNSGKASNVVYSRGGGFFIYNGWKYYAKGTNFYKSKNGVVKKLAGFQQQAYKMINLNADKQSPASSVQSTKRWVKGDAYVSEG